MSRIHVFVIRLSLMLLTVCTACEPLQDVEPSSAVTLKDRGRSENLGAVKPIKALYITDYSSFWHDYKAQQQTLKSGIGRYVNIEFNLVGKNPNDARRMLKKEHFSAGYDVVVYNMCFPDDTDVERIDNMIAQTRPRCAGRFAPLRHA